MRCIWLLCLSFSLCAQSVDISHLGTGTVSLAGEWRFHPGDDPHWADPSFNDSGWQSVKVPVSLNQQGYRNLSGYGWYRLRLRADAPASDLALLLWAVGDVAEVFANGASVGRFGVFPPHARVYDQRPIIFNLPASRWLSQRHLVLAVRLWMDPRLAAGVKRGILGDAPMIGAQSVIRAERNAARLEFWRLQILPATLICTELVVVLYLVVLYLSRYRRPEYLWFALAFFSDATYNSTNWMRTESTLLTFLQAMYTLFLLQPVIYTCLIFGIWSVYREVVPRWTKVLLGTLACAAVFDVVATQSGHWNWIRHANNQLDPRVMLDLAACFVIVVFLLHRVRGGFAGARWLAVCYGVFALYQLTSNALKVVALYRPTISQQTLRPWRDLSFLGGVIGVGYLLMRRFGQAEAESERLHNEMEAAHEVQSLLMPLWLPFIPGFAIETAYLPFQEVGGDFFQLATASDGSLLITIGDVSGKGLRAALTVNFVVGLWKEITASISSPAEILLHLNRQLKGSLKGGFVTCLCARLASDGCLTIANAGHLAPYLNGSELAINNSLPLGITEQSEYEESHHLLSPRDSLTFLSDGVVEARDKSQSLFGFERLQQELSKYLGADALARCAQQFGQEDDITVISISRQVTTAELASQTQTASVAV